MTSGANNRSLKVLVVEDEGLVAAGLKGQLEDIGHQVLGLAKDAEEAVRLASKLQPDLIMMDIRIPGTDGIEAARAILAQEAVPIVFLTAYPDEDFVRRAGDAGAMAYLLKPVNESTLRSTIEVALARFTELGALRREVNDLKEALETRKLVEKAKGVLMKRVQLSEAEAFRRMQHKSRTTRTSLKVIASTIVQADDLLSPFEETP
ncbi:MAG: ANTAR domain-containing response regulator [Candidatus Methylomirabilales bacterium]|nr:response regulator [candidate division NC10 bacterium]